MHFEDIKAYLRKRGSSQAALARQCEVTKQTVGGVIRGQTKSRRLALAISAVTQLPVEQLWPGKYPELASSQQPLKRKGGRS